MKEFGISHVTLSGMETEEQKQNYIVTMMRRKINEDFEKWKKEADKREKDVQKHDFRKNLQSKSDTEKTDVFKWLRLKTKYNSLSLYSSLLSIFGIVDFRF